MSKIFRPIVFALCLALLVWMVIKAGPMQLWSTLCSMPGTIMLCVLLWGVGYLLNAASFREVLLAVYPPFRSTPDGQKHRSTPDGQEQKGMNFGQILRLTIVGYVINYVTPFGLLGGEPYRVLELKPAMGTEKATRSVVLYSTMHIVSHFCFWVIAGVVGYFCFRTENKIEETDGVSIALSLTGVVSLFDWRHLPAGPRYKALGYELLSRMVNVFEYMLIMQAMGFASFGYCDAFLCVAFSSLFANVLFFSPMQMGTREGGILLALQHILPSQPAPELLAVALSLSFATRIREVIWIVVGLIIMKRK